VTEGRAPARPSRREFLFGAAGLLALAPYGCGTTGRTGVKDAGGAFPRDVRHELGSTEVAALPRKIVSATGLAELDSLLALGVKPLAAGRFTTGWNPWAEDEGLSGVEPLAVEPEVNIEEVAAQGPTSSSARRAASARTTSRSCPRSRRPSRPASRTGG
jgi:iron complex transport system substrate-binding protein